jgi:nitroimidazol reductase NimA-like FMN-containing flavoprotein (pyridoxamine 5'-phosphate oxidase superfamily)
MPHSIPIGYFRSGDDVYVGGRAGTQKMRNVQRNPNVSLLLQSGGSMQDIKGLMIQGRGTVLESSDDLLQAARDAAKWRGVPEAQWPTEARPGSAYIRVTPTRLISWDYSREG